jgi:hypothetical protein
VAIGTAGETACPTSLCDLGTPSNSKAAKNLRLMRQCVDLLDDKRGETFTTVSDSPEANFLLSAGTRFAEKRPR